LASIQHVYRRGHIFWWRRVLCILGESGCDIRLSLGTADRRRARKLGAMLMAASGDVTMLVEERVRRADERPSEAELQAIAKAEFQNQLARFCDQQREHPQQRAMHRPANLAYADYYQRMIDTGGRAEFVEGEEAALLDERAGGSADLETAASESRNDKAADNRGVEAAFRGDARSDGDRHGKRQRHDRTVRPDSMSCRKAEKP
jgi:hypothetical protein